MISWLERAAAGGQNAPGAFHCPRGCRPAAVQRFRRQTMKWETPTATDLRFGFEITMYVSAR